MIELAAKKSSVKIPRINDVLVLGYSKRHYTVQDVVDGVVYYNTYADKDLTPLTLRASSLRLLDEDWGTKRYWVDAHVRNLNFAVTFLTPKGENTITSFAPSMRRAAANVVHRIGGEVQKANGKLPINADAVAHKYLAEAAGRSQFTNDLLTVTFA